MPRRGQETTERQQTETEQLSQPLQTKEMQVMLFCFIYCEQLGQPYEHALFPRHTPQVCHQWLINK